MENKPVSQNERTTKKQRGGQPGNQNARQHGLYSPVISSDDVSEYSRDVMVRGIDPSIALVRARLRTVLLHAPSNRRALDDAAGSLAKTYSEKFGLDKTNTRLLKSVFLAVIESCSLVVDCGKNKAISQNESSVL